MALAAYKNIFGSSRSDQLTLSGVTNIMPSLLSKWKHKRTQSKQSAQATKSSTTETVTPPSSSSGDTKANADAPATSEAASAKPTSTIVPEVGETPQGLQVRLWNQAYDGVKATDPELVEAYERILSTKLRGKGAETCTDASTVSNDIARTREPRAVQMQHLVRIGLEKTQREAAVKQKIGDGMAVIAVVKGVIDKAVQASPEAAIAWVGVSFALEVS